MSKRTTATALISCLILLSWVVLGVVDRAVSAAPSQNGPPSHHYGTITLDSEAGHTILDDGLGAYGDGDDVEAVLSDTKVKFQSGRRTATRTVILDFQDFGAPTITCVDFLVIIDARNPPVPLSEMPVGDSWSAKWHVDCTGDDGKHYDLDGQKCTRLERTGASTWDFVAPGPYAPPCAYTLTENGKGKKGDIVYAVEIIASGVFELF